MSIDVWLVKEVVGVLASAVSMVVGIVAVWIAARAYRRKAKQAPLGFDATQGDVEEARSLIASVQDASTQDQVPFEIGHLARYYAQVLMQSKVAFWFSLLFAAVGFFVIIAAALMYTDGKATATVLQGISGIVVDGVAALFFVQSKRAQAAMTEFFEKLRKDRQQAESRRLCEEVKDPASQDAVRIQLALYYAGLENHDEAASRIVEKCYGSSGLKTDAREP